ncbi:MAG TPA: hypothetical protein VMW12_10075 [Candidatus Dormibacteraeota bacterium]|nr:hypothetical protein [Candidatus Dormibacteraeota bacterium]
MKYNFLRTAVAGIALCSLFVTATPRPAKANTTTTILLGAAAIAGLATAINVENKHRAAGTVVGYLSNGDPVYQDGHIVGNNGQVYYPANNGQQVSCNGQQCYLVAANGNNGYYNNGNNGYYGNANNNNGYYGNTTNNNNGYYGNAGNNGYANGYANGNNRQNDDRGRGRGRRDNDGGPGHS